MFFLELINSYSSIFWYFLFESKPYFYLAEKEKKNSFVKIVGIFVNAGFVKTCDEHVNNHFRTIYDVSAWTLLEYIFYFLTFPACFSIPIIFSNLNYNCSNFLDLRNLQEQVKKAFCYQKLFWPFTVRINCSSDLKIFANSRPSASNFFLDH